MFQSFFLAGFEGSTGFNRHGRWFDQVAATGHDLTVDADYRALAELGINAVRETVRWPLVDRRHGRYDFASLDPFLEAARRHRIGVIWDLFHYGYPRELDPLSEAFQRRFADYCYAVGRHVAARTDGLLAFTPVNEPSFFAYAGGEKALFAPHLEGRGWDLKVALARAAIEGIDALRAAAPAARIVNVDPICRVAVPADRPDLDVEAAHFNDTLVFQSFDIIAGRLLPELGGSRDHLDVVGVNYYWTNQWELGAAAGTDGVVPPLADDDPRRLPLSTLIETVAERYGGEVMITETAHVGDRRGPWLAEVAAEARAMLDRGIALSGVCLYPILGMPQWHDPDVWTPMGLWDPVCHREPHGDRLVCTPMLDALAGAADIEARHRRRMAERPTPLAARRRVAGDRASAAE